MLPTMRCGQRMVGEVTADSDSEAWRGLAGQPMLDVLDGGTPGQGGLVKCAWTPERWHVLFTMVDSHVWATKTGRGALLYEEEVAEVFIDPIGDLECYFEIEVNPLNAVLEVILRRNRSGYARDFSWRCDGLETAVRRTAEGWCAELAIPFRSLVAERPRVGNSWRANFCRIDRPPGVPRELTAWSPAGRASFHTPERFGWIEFVD